MKIQYTGSPLSFKFIDGATILTKYSRDNIIILSLIMIFSVYDGKKTTVKVAKNKYEMSEEGK